MSGAAPQTGDDKPFRLRDAHEAGAVAIARAVRSGEVTAVQVAAHFLDRIEQFDGALHCFLHVDRDRVLTDAQRIDTRRAAGKTLGRLAGVPVALKDNLCRSGVPTTAGSKLLEGWSPPYDADVVTKLEAADAVLVGKTNLDEFAMGSSTEWSAWGPTRNPWDTARVPGGSSGGSAAAVAAGLVPLALGSDTGGSIRQPAALCGVHGVMGTYGRVSRRGLVAFGSSLDRIGPLALRTEDAALCLEVLSGGDSGDSTSVCDPAPRWSESLGEGIGGLKVGVLATDVPVEPAVQARMDAALGALEAAGAILHPVELPHMEHGIPVYYLVAPSEASSNLARYDGIRYGVRRTRENQLETMRATREAGFGPEVKRRILLGTFALSAGYADAFYEKALRVRRLIADDYARVFRDVDVVVSPTSPFPAFELGAKLDDPYQMYLCDIFATPASLAGLPGASVPVGTTDDGLPVGLQVVARLLGEAANFRVAAALEQTFGPAPVAPPPSRSKAGRGKEARS